RYIALPIEAAVAGDGNAAVESFADRELAGRLIADIAVYIGVNPVLGRPAVALEGADEGWPILGAVNLDERKLPHSRIGGCPMQSRFLAAHLGHNGPIGSEGHRQHHVGRSLHVDNLLLNPLGGW